MFRMRWAVVIERAAESNYSAYVPDLPGCVAVGDSVEETQRQIQQAIEFHIEGLRADGLRVPEPTSQIQYVEVSA
jgi:predicted RNase H-like HicB family nuclease